MTASHRWTLIVVLASASTLCAQPPENRPADANQQSNQRSGSQPPRQNLGQGSGRSSNAAANGRMNGETGRGLNVERGSIPRLFSQQRGQSNAAGQQGQGETQSQRPSGGRSQASGGQREFIQNALRFDSNSDRKLAANELANLFHVLASSQQRQTSITRPQQTSTTSVSTQSTTTTNSNVQADTNFIQRDSVRQALVLFLQLALQFDTNGDGLLSQPELFNLASSLLANDMSLMNAAAQPSGRQSTTTSTSRNTIQSRTTSANQNINLGQKIRPPQSGKQGGRRNRRDRGDGPRTSDRPGQDQSANALPDDRPRGSSGTQVSE